MLNALTFTRLFFASISILSFVAYCTTIKIGWGLTLGLGFLFFATFVILDRLFQCVSLRSFNLLTLGLFFGFLMGNVLVMLFSTVMQMSVGPLPYFLEEPLQLGLMLVGAYMGTVATIHSAAELSVSIPFVRFSSTAAKKRDLLLDASALTDSRLIDLASSGLLDRHLVLPRFLLNELLAESEMGEEMTRQKAKKASEVVKKLSQMPDLDLRYNETDFSDSKDSNQKFLRLARLLDANILTADMSKVHSTSFEGVRIVNLNALSNALKPLMQMGEKLKIKIQRFGKEPRQGVGYLDDGTMVVVNGGGEFMGETIEAQVLSVKHTTSGRMIFCNAMEESGIYPVDMMTHGNS